MARRSAPRRTPRRPASRRAGLRLLLVPAVLVVATLGLAPTAAGAQEATAAPTLSDVLAGSVDGLRGGATVGADDSAGLDVRIVNDGAEAIEVAVPFGTLVATDAEGDQTLVVGPPETPDVVEVAASGGTPTVRVEPGNNRFDLAVYCAELGDSYPYEATVVHPLEPAHQVLADTMRRAAALDADEVAVQDAVWWLSDEPTLPVRSDIAPLLADVDTEAFAAEPFRVVPDTGYDPLWMTEETGPTGDDVLPPEPTVDDEQAAGILDESFDGGSGAPIGSSGDGGSTGILLWVALVGLVAVGTVVVASRAGRSRATPATVPVVAAGWYPDPMGGTGHRYWDGRSWTGRTLP